MSTLISIFILASAIVLSTVILAVAKWKGSQIMSAATDRLAASLTAHTASSDALIAALEASRNENGDAAANAAADALDAQTAKQNAAVAAAAPAAG